MNPLSILRLLVVLASLSMNACGAEHEVDSDDGAAVDSADIAAVDSGDIAAVDSDDVAAVDSGDIAAADSDDVAAVDSGDIAAVDSDVENTVLDERTGIGVALVALDTPVATAWVVEVAADGLAFELGDGPSLFRIAAPGDAEPSTRVASAPFVLAAGEHRALSRLVAWVPGATAVDVSARVRVDDAIVADGTLTFAAGTPARATLTTPDGGRVTFAATTGARGLAESDGVRVGLTVDGALAYDDLAARVPGPLAVKHYHGARRWLLRPGCDSDAACAEGGASWPCVSSCACHCDAAACDCDFSGLEATMESEALAAAHRIVGADADADALARARVHWVFKRSLGGTSSCDAHGELDVDPATWAAFFGAATRAAIAINQRQGFRLIDVLSPMNEANHPLQDGRHVNAAGQPTLGGFVSFVELVRQASCSGGHCCAPDRYIVEAPDVPALAAAAMAAAADVLAAHGPDALAPEVALSLYLDTEQTDPLQAGPDGAPPSIVTPVAPFMRDYRAALAGRAAPDALVVVDTYPGSWGAPWFASADGIVHHMDPATRRIVRPDPVVAADAAITRALAAADDVAAVTGTRPRVWLGEVGWSTFDGDELAQARFAARLVDAAAAARATDDTFDGFVWFKTKDRAPAGYPTWTQADNPLGGDPIACDTAVVGPIVCAADVLARMEGHWGLVRVDGGRKPSWEALIGRWARR